MLSLSEADQQEQPPLFYLPKRVGLLSLSRKRRSHDVKFAANISRPRISVSLIDSACSTICLHMLVRKCDKSSYSGNQDRSLPRCLIPRMDLPGGAGPCDEKFWIPFCWILRPSPE